MSVSQTSLEEEQNETLISRLCRINYLRHAAEIFSFDHCNIPFLHTSLASTSILVLKWLLK